MNSLSDNTRGVIFMVLSMASFTFNDAFIKTLSADLPFFQTVFLRGALTAPMIAALAWVMGDLRFSFAAKDWLRVLLRTAAEVAAAYFFITALFNMPIANATAILQALPLSVTLAGALFLREPVGWHRLSAILVGFFGVLLIINPGPNGFNIYALYVLLAVVCVTIRDLAARKLSPTVPSLSVAVVAVLAVTVFGGIGSMSEEWVPLTPRTGGLLLRAAIMCIGGYVFSIMAMRVGDLATVAPFRYTSLLWALLLGWYLFGEWPDTQTLIGAVIVVGAGSYALYRGNRVQAQKTA